MERWLLLALAAFALGSPPAVAQQRLPPIDSDETWERPRTLDLAPGIRLGEPPTAEEEPAPFAAEPVEPALPVRRHGGGGMGGPGGGGPPGYDATWYPAQSVSGQNSEFELLRQSLSFGAPVWRGESGMVLAMFSVKNSWIETDAVLPDTLRPFPKELWNVNLGLNYMRPFDNSWTGGLMGGIGASGDKPFESFDELTGNLGAFLRVPARNDRDSWQFMLMFMYGGPLNFPIPMVSYTWNPTDQLRVNVGLPFSLAWEPTENLMLSLSYFPLYNINARLTYRVAPDFVVFDGYEFLNESYFLADRADQADRFFAYEQRVIAGLRWEFWSVGAAELNAGYSFGRRYGEGDSQWSSLHDRVDIGAGPFAGLSFRMLY